MFGWRESAILKQRRRIAPPPPFMQTRVKNNIEVQQDQRIVESLLQLQKEIWKLVKKMLIQFVVLVIPYQYYNNMPWQLGEQYNNETTETEITPEKDLFSVCKAHWQRCPDLLAKKMQIHWECVNTYNYGDISCKDP